MPDGMRIRKKEKGEGGGEGKEEKSKWHQRIMPPIQIHDLLTRDTRLLL